MFLFNIQYYELKAIIRSRDQYQYWQCGTKVLHSDQVENILTDSLFPNTPFKVELGCRNRAALTNARVMTPFGLSKSTLNYVYCTLEYYLLFLNCSRTRLQAQEHQYEQNTNHLYIIVYSQKCGNVPIHVSKIIFNPLVWQGLTWYSANSLYLSIYK